MVVRNSEDSLQLGTEMGPERGLVRDGMSLFESWLGWFSAALWCGARVQSSSPDMAKDRAAGGLKDSLLPWLYRKQNQG